MFGIEHLAATAGFIGVMLAFATAGTLIGRAALGPLIDATKAVGVVSLPGAMTGMILAGVSPLDAVQLQVVVMFMLLAATSVSVLLTVELGTARLFDESAQLVRSAAQRQA